MNQLGLDFAPRSHRDDPASSHEAEARSRTTWATKHADLMWVLRIEPAMTSTEIAQHRIIKSDDQWPANETRRLMEVRRRLSDLRTCNPPRVRRVHSKGEKESRWFLAT